MSDNLIVISEGGVHTLEYLHRNGVFPHVYVLKPSYFEEVIPYLSENDTILFIINGLTDFTLSEVYNFLNTLKGVKDDVKNIVVMSNIYLGVNFDFDYYLYQGDLFYSKVKEVKGGKIVEEKDKSKTKNKKEKEVVKNEIMFSFKEFDNNTNIKLKGKPFAYEDSRVTEIDNSLIDKIHYVDFFKEK